MRRRDWVERCGRYRLVEFFGILRSAQDDSQTRGQEQRQHIPRIGAYWRMAFLPLQHCEHALETAFEMGTKKF